MRLGFLRLRTSGKRHHGPAGPISDGEILEGAALHLELLEIRIGEGAIGIERRTGRYSFQHHQAFRLTVRQWTQQDSSHDAEDGTAGGIPRPRIAITRQKKPGDWRRSENRLTL